MFNLDFDNSIHFTRKTIKVSKSSTINPYYLVGEQIAPGLDAIIGNLPASPTTEDLINEVVSYVTSLYNTNPPLSVTVEYSSIAAHAINSFRSNLILEGNADFNESQGAFIDLMIGHPMVSQVSPDALVEKVRNIEENIAISNLTVHEQIPLFLATASGVASYIYWEAQIKNQASAWAPYFSSIDGQNYMNTLRWSLAAMNGSLSGYGSSISGLVEPSYDRVTNLIVSSLIGALALTAGKLIFNWSPIITKPLDPTPSEYRCYAFYNRSKPKPPEKK